MKFINKNKKTLLFILTIIFSVIFITAGYKYNKPDLDEHAYDKSYKARILSIEDEIEENYDYGFNNISNKTIVFKAEITNDDYEGTVVDGYQYIDELIEVNPKEVEAGDNVLISYIESRSGQGNQWTFIEYNRSNILIMLLAGFFILLIIFGGKKGINTIISLVLTCLSIFLVFIPSILKGNNIYVSSVVISVFIVFMTLLVVNGWNTKTYCAIVGNLGGLFVAGFLAYIISNILNLTGLIDQDSIFLLMINPDVHIDLKAILWSSIVIGSLGAVMDVSMSIASALYEISENSSARNYKTLLKSGFNIGQDAIGTMSNTLILAYIGSSLSVVLLLFVNHNDMLLLFNLEIIVFEIIQAIIGSMGILFAIPLTSIFAAYIYSTQMRKLYEE